MFTDTHCHIYEEYYSDFKNVLDNAQNKGINRLINNGCNMVTNQEVIAISKEIPNVFGAIGIHPENVNSYKERDIEFIKKNINNKEIIAIGEIGLDYHYTKDNRDEQLKLFECQLKIAEDNDMPVIIHSREATDATLRILKKYKLKGVIHSFSGSLETAQEYIKLGYLLGINGVVTFKNCKLKEILPLIPLENIILETDSPYLTPHPYRGQKNEPAYIKDIAEFVSNVYKISLEDLSIITNANIKRVFDI